MKKYMFPIIICLLFLQCKSTEVTIACDCKGLAEGEIVKNLEGTLHIPSNSNSAYAILLKRDTTIFIDMPSVSMYAICADSLFLAQIKSKNLKEKSPIRINGNVVYLKQKTYFDVYLCDIKLGNDNYQRQPVRITSIEKL